MKEKILFMLINMNLGGTEKAFLNLLEKIDTKKYEITLLLLENKGELLNEIPSHVKIKVIEEYSQFKEYINNPPITNIKEYLRKKEYIKFSENVEDYIKGKIIGTRESFYKRVFKNVKIEEKYDIAIAYAGPMELITYFISEKITANKKYQWVHFDVSKIGFNIKFAKKYFNKFDKVIAVSKEAEMNLKKSVESLKDKVVTRHNDIPIKKILKLSEEKGFDDDFEGKRILTVGRISEEKGYDLAIKACEKLAAKNYNFRWYCIGTGGKIDEYKEFVRKRGMEDKFIFLGMRRNPYPYMKECDIYVQPSRHEGFCITLGEAKLFKRSIVSTKFLGAKEQLESMRNYKIVEIDYEAIANGIEVFIK